MKMKRIVLGRVVEHVEFVIWKSNLMRASRHTHVILDSFFLPPVVSPFIKAGKREFSNWPWHCIEPWLMPRHWTTLCAYYWDARDLWKWKTGPCVVEVCLYVRPLKTSLSNSTLREHQPRLLRKICKPSCAQSISNWSMKMEKIL